MAKSIKLVVTCPSCSGKTPISITENMLGTTIKCTCTTCRKQLPVKISESLASKFNSDKTEIGGKSADFALHLDVEQNELTPHQTFELVSDYYTIGRKNNGGPEHRADVEVVTTDMKMSRKHAAVKKKPNGAFTFKDIGSKNGVFYNGSKLDADEEVYLSDGDKFQIGQTMFKVSIVDRVSKDDDVTVTA